MDYKDAAGNTVDAQFYDKFMNKAKAGADRFDWAINYPVLRYADILMMKAECILQGGIRNANRSGRDRQLHSRPGRP
ncbi:MAG: RagB/SusD family nutrient uptake outer membrane protein [Haliscomenobacter sp.]|nr:RagB/SusD family nutrient uptake outer membrane protein [Haliscomenobacter sp.]